MKTTKEINHEENSPLLALGLDKERMESILSQINTEYKGGLLNTKSALMVRAIELSNCPEEIALLAMILGYQENDGCDDCPIKTLLKRTE